MTSLSCLKFLLSLLLLHLVCTEDPELVLRARGTMIEIGYCFGVDYIVVYRSGQKGDQLLSNSSESSSTTTSSEDLRDRIFPSHSDQLLGLQIINLTHKDSGIYRRECWQNEALVKHYSQQLIICEDETESKEIILKEEADETEIQCTSNATIPTGSSVRWYSEIYPTYKKTLFLDSSVSMEPLVEELQGVMKVKYNGASLVLKNSMLKSIHQFHCLVISGEKCLSFQTLYLPDQSDSRDIFVSQQDKLVLKCPSNDKNQHWETPLGMMNSSCLKNSKMFISTGHKSEDFSLVIPEITEEHSGDYTCISSSFELHYYLILCPKHPREEKVYFLGSNLSLDCKNGYGDSQRVQWYRRGTSGENVLIRDSNEDISIPEDLMGRLTLSDKGVLTISDMVMTDAGEYYCVVLSDEKSIKHDYEEYHHDGDDDDDDDGEYVDEEFTFISNRCIFKQDTLLTLNIVRTASDTGAHIAGAGITVGLLVVGLIIALIVVKKRRAASQARRQTNTDMSMRECRVY